MSFSTPSMGAEQVPHRGALVLVLGILSIVICGILGIFAWVMANHDLREIDDGLMDPTGRDLIVAGKVCGIIGTVLLTIPLVIMLVWLCIMLLVVANG